MDPEKCKCQECRHHAGECDKVAQARLTHKIKGESIPFCGNCGVEALISNNYEA